MGDSVTFGQHIDPRVRWTSLLSDRLTSKYAGTPVTVESINSGVSGETTRMGLERYPASVQAHEAPVMTLQFGLNDCNCWQSDRGLPRVSPAAFEANLVEMIERARTFGARQILLSTNHRTLRRAVMSSGEQYEAANARYSEISRRVAAACSVTLCDIRAAFEKFDDAALEELLLPYPDQLHLSPSGNRVYADAMWPLLEVAVAACADESMEAAPR
jgi:lysophospholipase L1-like esterase